MPTTRRTLIAALSVLAVLVGVAPGISAYAADGPTGSCSQAAPHEAGDQTVLPRATLTGKGASAIDRPDRPDRPGSDRHPLQPVGAGILPGSVEVRLGSHIADGLDGAAIFRPYDRTALPSERAPPADHRA